MRASTTARAAGLRAAVRAALATPAPPVLAPATLAAAVLWAAILCPARAPAEEHALRFAGSQRLTLPALDAAGPHTIELWLRPRALASASQPAAVFTAGGAGIDLSSAGADYWLDLGGPAPARVSLGGIEADRWRHLAASFDGARMRFFLDGRLVNVRIALGPPAPHPGAAGFLGAGEGRSGFLGELDEVRFWSRARGEEEIRADYRQKLAGGEPGLLASWSFDEGRGQLALDSSPAARHGVLGRSRFQEAQDPSWEESSSPVRRPDPAYLLTFDPPGPLSTRSGEEFTVSCVLASPAGAPAPPLRGWSICVRHDRLLHFLLETDLSGTEVEPYLSSGFVHFESLDGPSGTGFIARAILEEEEPALPASGRLTIARATYRSLAPLAGDRASTAIRYEEGLWGVAGPGRNMAHVGERQVFPREGSLSISIQAPEVALGFVQEEGVQVTPGGRFNVECLLRVSENPGEGAQSWSISVQHDPSVLEIVEATTSGTVVERAEEETGVFQITELVQNDSGAGFLSAVILSLDRPYSLPSNGEERIARARYRVREGVPVGTATSIAYRDGLQQSGVAIENLVVFQAGPTAPRTALLPVRVLPVVFLRGDLNGDRRVNLSDAILIMTWLFWQSFDPPCLKAGDVNDDGVVDVTDPVFLLGALFLKGPRPSPPYPAPGGDPSPDLLGCERPEE